MTAQDILVLVAIITLILAILRGVWALGVWTMAIRDGALDTRRAVRELTDASLRHDQDVGAVLRALENHEMRIITLEGQAEITETDIGELQKQQATSGRDISDLQERRMR